jgi:hypothetical protein
MNDGCGAKEILTCHNFHSGINASFSNGIAFGFQIIVSPMLHRIFSTEVNDIGALFSLLI